MSAHQLAIHAVSPPDSMLSDCQTSCRGESYQRSSRLRYIPANVTDSEWFSEILWFAVCTGVSLNCGEGCTYAPCAHPDNKTTIIIRPRKEGKEKHKWKRENVWAGCVGVPESVYTEQEREREPHNMWMVLRGTARFKPPPQQKPRLSIKPYYCFTQFIHRWSPTSMCLPVPYFSSSEFSIHPIPQSTAISC